jgi:hypothetical protein
MSGKSQIADNITAIWNVPNVCRQMRHVRSRGKVTLSTISRPLLQFGTCYKSHNWNQKWSYLFVCFNASRRDAYPIYFLDPLPDCIVSTECYMSIDVHRPRISCWVWIRTIEGSYKITRRPSTSRPPGHHLSSQPARHLVRSKFDTWGSEMELNKTENPSSPYPRALY